MARLDQNALKVVLFVLSSGELVLWEVDIQVIV